MAGTAHVVLDLSSRPENVPVVRQALAGLAEAIALSPADFNDVNTALTEACNNASLHAYAGAEGPVEVELNATRDWLTATVRDRGRGLGGVGVPAEFPREVDGKVGGIGLPAIHGLASRVQLRDRDGGGAEVAMEFATSGLGSEPRRALPERTRRERLAVAPGRVADTIELDMAPLSIGCAVLARVACALGARAHFPVDRLGDLRSLCTLLLADGRHWTHGDRVQAGVFGSPGSVELDIEPLRADSVGPLIDAVRKLDPAIEGLVPAGRAAGVQRLLLRVPRARAQSGQGG
jgi:serine/threonine-protein kinase RsbW